MAVDRRRFLAAVGAVAIARGQSQPDPRAIPELRPMTDGIQPITDSERRERMDKARRLMVENKIGGIFLEGGSSLFYFTGVRWGRSERTFGAVLPARGDLAWVVPAFEEARARELIRFDADIRTWEEDESPFRRIAQILKDRGIVGRSVGVEEQVRFFVFDGIRKQAPSAELVSADPVTAGCRMIKGPAEIALLQRANNITIAAYRAGLATLDEGMSPSALADNIRAAYRALGVTGDVTVNFGEYTAFPHGSVQPQKLRPGDIVQIDDGCTVEGYQSDITRTVVFGKPSPRQIEIWNLERKAQDAAFAAARPGATCESVDAAARKVITDAGFGPGYKVPGLPHRTGHGIGLDGHEWPYLVRGNRTLLRPGMCFSDEPMIAIYGEFGIRLEDCMYITEDGARMFTRQSPGIDQPFG
ncbi:MAG TPA: Xaa-Pro peptidase family protein [Bryobacteraceae bacterium]|nr:Xaa-Pro peptidase family protein [Bryobacteraceae bacterium]